MSWKENVRNWDGKLYKVLRSNKSCHGGDFEWSLPKDGNPGDWAPIIDNVKMCKRGYHLTTHYAHWSDYDVSIYEAEGDVVEFDGFDKVVCSRARLLRLVENPFPENNSGNYNSGNYNSGNVNSGDNNSGNRNSGNYNSGNNNVGIYNTGNRNSGNENTGNDNLGDKNSGDCNSGYGNTGNKNFGKWNSGYSNLGNYNTGNYNSGDWNSGDWNSGNDRSRYFCKNSPSIIIFEKQAPENWKPKFPEWIYFELLPEGYYASWQKAFENADVEGIKELLALPNFDYEIFEKITSITKKQIEEKLGIMCWENEVKNWNGKLYKVLQGNKSCHGGNFEWDLPKNGKPGNWTPTIEDVEMCERGYHLTTHYAHWSNIYIDVSIYEAEGDVVRFDGFDKVVCTRARLLRLVENPFPEDNSGRKNSGHNNSGDYNSGNYNSGNFNSGSWNSGCFNLGYFCTGYRHNKIFNESIPESWKPRFPEWIYFKLLPEGYHASWQKAFENANVEGIKELLALPNFNYRIFEEVTSITKRQVEEKLILLLMIFSHQLIDDLP